MKLPYIGSSILTQQTPFYVVLIKNNTHNSKSSAISFKNKFLISKISTTKKLTSFFYYKGLSKYSDKSLSTSFVNFLRLVFGLAVKMSNKPDLQNLLKISPDFLRIFSIDGSLRDLGRAFLFRAEPLAPKIKSVCITFRKKKKKKIKKYTIEYRFIGPKTRLQVINRWAAMLTRVLCKKLYDSIFKVYAPFIIKPEKSRLFLVRQKVYGGLALK